MKKKRRLSNKTKIRKAPGRMIDIEIDTEKSPVLLPPDVVIEILKRFPLTFVTRCLLVSKQWLTIIRSQEFIRSFPCPSLQPQPQRFLFAVYSLEKYRGCGRYNWFFYLSSSNLVETEHHHFFSPLSYTQCQIPFLRRCFSDVHYVNGLLSLGYGHQQIINNPSTGKSIFLPKVKTRKQIIQSYFGFDLVSCQYKVLCMSERINDYSNVPCSDHQVITVGGREKQSWRMIECNTPHCPKTNGVCIDGVLYYGAFTGVDMVEWCIMRFDVRTEKLDFCSGLNEKVESFRPEINPPCLINYQGKVALAAETSLNTFDLWVMEDAQKWSKVRLSTNIGVLSPEDSVLRIRGTIHTGEIVFITSNTRNSGEGDTRRVSVVFYNHRENRVRQVMYGVKFKFTLGTDCIDYVPNICLVVPFLDYVESAMLL